MGTTCIIGFDDNKVIKDFLRLHVENLKGPVICLACHQYSNYAFKGRTIRYFYSQRPLAMKLAKLLPHFLYERLITKHEQSFERTVDAVGAFVKQHNVDVFLAEFGMSGAKISPIAEKLGIPVVVHFHGHDAHREPELTEETRSRYQRLFDYASGVLGVSLYMMSALKALGCPESKLTYNPYGPRTFFYEVEPSYEPVVLSVGRFTNIKANYLVVLAFAEALKEVPDARLVMVGDGELLETCITLAQVNGIADKIQFTGAIPHQQVVELFKHACCFAQHSVIPSYGDAEGTPNTILEAQAAALPIVSTRHAGICDVVVENETGFLVDERDVKGMAESMVKLLRDPALCRKMGNAAREHVRRNFNSEQHIQRLQAVIDAARQ